jgi:NAD(P)-dependent dehydrogenase (short-subunit alcohol dehydrogenase family)
MFQQIAAEHGRLDILVLNAARAPFKRVDELLTRDLLELIETNYLGNIYCMQQALPLMRGRPATSCSSPASVVGSCCPATRLAA